MLPVKIDFRVQVQNLILKFSLKAGCQVTTDCHGRTLLHQAAISGHAQMVQYLVMHQEMLQLDVAATDHDGRNALFYW